MSIGGGVVARLRAVMGLDTQEFEAGIAKSKGGAKSLQATLKDVAGIMGVAFSVGAVVSYGKAFMDWAGKISDAAGNVGILTSEMAALNAVFAKQGLGTDELQKMFSKIETDVFGAATGGKELDDVYTRLGLTIGELVKMSPDERFRAVAKAALESANATGALAEVFGAKVGPKARLALEDMAAGYDKVDEAIGRTIDSLDNAGDRWAGYMNNAKMALIPVIGWLDKVYEKVTDAVAVQASNAGKVRNPVAMFKQWRAMGSAREESEAGKSADAATIRAKEKADLVAAAAEASAAAEAKKRGEQEKTVKVFGEKWLSDKDKEFAAFVKREDDKRKKREDTARRVNDLEQRLAERLVSIQENTRGRGVNPDSLAGIGGFLGNERAGMAERDRVIQVQIDSAKAVKENTEAIRELKAAVDSANPNSTGAGD
ncbi:MAG TPA: hypothetical protein DCY07_05105 [Rhodospirillaceae bacterium]|nr:hypothetical protein [Rhodospirillaceae bacterium]